jgi:hypothetical protein
MNRAPAAHRGDGDNLDGVDLSFSIVFGGPGGLSLVIRERQRAMGSSRHGGRSGGSGLAWPAWRRPQAAEGGAGQRLLACLTVEGLVNHLLDRAARQLPQAFRDRFAEEWQDHRTRPWGGCRPPMRYRGGFVGRSPTRGSAGVVPRD